MLDLMPVILLLHHGLTCFRGNSQVHSRTTTDVKGSIVHQPSICGVQELRKVRRRHQQPTATNRNQPTLGDFFAIRNLTRLSDHPHPYWATPNKIKTRADNTGLYLITTSKSCQFRSEASF